MGATSSDVLVVFKTDAALRRLGEQTHHGIDVPAGSPAAESEIISYHTRRGLVLGQSVDQTSLYLDAVGNEFLYGQGVKPGAIGQSVRAGLRPPPCVQKFVEQTNTLQGKPASTMQWR
ncbi:MAG: YSC84-related protein [Thiobacillaceae bacterium]|nr:YSC84-related protein [Thiobacillaceae bacterium]